MHEKMPKYDGQPLLDVYRHPEMTWVDVRKPSAEASAKLKELFPFFLEMDLRDCLPPYQRPKLLERGQYLFMVMLFPYFDRDKRAIRSTELDIFIGPNFIVTNHFGVLPPLQSMAELFRGDRSVTMAQEVERPADWLHAMLNQLYIGCFPMLTHVSNDINTLESRMFTDAQNSSVKEILRVKSNIVDFRRIMQAHKHVLEKFIAVAPRILHFQDLHVYYEDLVGHTQEIWDFLDNDRNTIDAVYESYLSLVTYETGQATKTLTALAFIVFPMNLAAAIFSMRAENMPLLGVPGDFWFMLGIVFLVMVATMGYLKSRKWL
ncbi:MAG: magnesium transporter CorA family protein [Patescibacteria group bacterium]|nr:magnesium transporter CorA family protein [Patescibacteria group bacterium]